jgi:P27 family predicted phage terminase small subunit
VQAPAFLKGDALAEFTRVAPMLERLGLLTQLDIASLACYAVAVADFHWAVAILEKEGRVAMTSKGTPSIHPAFRIQRSAADAILRFSTEFGMSASARSSLSITAAGAMDAREAKFFGLPQPDPYGPHGPYEDDDLFD